MSSTSIQAKMFKAVSADTNSIATSQTTAGAANLSLTSASVNDGSNMASTVTIKSISFLNVSIKDTVDSLTPKTTILYFKTITQLEMFLSPYS